MIIDVAGADSGGAARFRRELHAFLATHPESGQQIRLIGEGERTSSTWLVRRELGTRHEARIALNNVGFLRRGGRRTVLLRNALHFLTPDEAQTVETSRALRAQIPLVRAGASRADRVVVPSQAMADRVLRHLPGVADRLVVKHHPLTVPSPQSRGGGLLESGESFVLLPSVWADHKRLGDTLRLLCQALDSGGSEARIVATFEQHRLPDWRDDRVTFVGPQSPEAILGLMDAASAAFVGTTIESFCYPLAEARALGVPVVVREDADTLDVAGAAAVTFGADRQSLAEALARALAGRPEPDAGAFDAEEYFRWLLN